MLGTPPLLDRPLDKNNPEPLYMQLYYRLVQLIEKGELKAGDRVPAERELAETLNVSRITARQAIDALVKNGLVYREQGRGTFVAEPHMTSVMGFTSFYQDMIARGHKPGSIILVQEKIRVDEELQKVLKIGPDDYALHLVRVRTADGEPVAYQSAYLPDSRFPMLDQEDLSSISLYAVLREKYSVYPAWTEAQMEVRLASPEESRLLKLDKNAPVLIVNGITYTDSFEVVESVSTVYRGEGLSLYIGRQRIPTFNR